MILELETATATPEVEAAASATNTLPQALEWLCNEGVLERADAHRVASAVNSAGARNGDWAAYLRGKIASADLHEAACRAGAPLPVSRMADLPDWNLVLNASGGPLAGPVSRNSVAVIANDQEAREQMRCFVLHAAAAPRAEITAGVTGIVGMGHRVAGIIQVPDDVLKVLFSDWDGRGRKGQAVGASDAALHAEFDALCEDAIRLRASDIHISSNGSTAAIYLRVDGNLEHHRDLTANHARDLVNSVYNTMTEASSVTEGYNPNKPQDSAIERSLSSGLYRFRFSSVPMAPSGFDVTMRVIPIGVSTRRSTPQELGYSPDQEVLLDRMFSRASGMVLFAGTTGSGKSTSMANLIRKLAEDRPGKKIRTVEEPVEIIIPGAYQHPVTRLNDDGSDFLVMLRQLMRSDPDVVMIGEIRDVDTAHMAIQTVRSGHLCVSTIHADGAPLCYDRLVGMGVSRLDLASVNLIAGLVFQTLVPTLCPRCKVPAATIDAAIAPSEVVERLARVRKVNNGTLDGVYVRKEGGCLQCRHRGVHGRTVCAEILRPTTDMLPAIAKGDSRAIWRMWRRTITDDPANMTGRTAFEHAIHKMRLGVVAPEDVELQFRYLDEEPFEDAA